MKLKFQGGIRHPNPGDAGFDLYATTVTSFARNYGHFICSSGVVATIPRGYVGLVKGRSSLAKLGVMILGGVIDSSYEGIIDVVLFCPHNQWHPKIGERIAQLVVVPCLTEVEGEETKEEVPIRGTKGFGSTGK